MDWFIKVEIHLRLVMAAIPVLVMKKEESSARKCFALSEPVYTMVLPILKESHFPPAMVVTLVLVALVAMSSVL
jgi:hypothetical protein